MTAALHPCGTPAAYRRHRRNNEDPCPACREANRVKSRWYRHHPQPKREPAPCGTDRGYHRHLRRREFTCAACCEAHAAAELARVTQKRKEQAACETC